MERLEFTDFKVSIKSTNVPNTIAANRLLSERIPYPLHLGITEAGTKWSGSLKSAVGLGTLLADGIGDTIRISLSTFHAEEEVKVAWEILKALKLRERGPVLIACPTCGRLQFDMDTVVADIERRLEAYADPVEVAVLGCAVNGIGEASHADFGITGAKNEGLIFSRGKALKKVPTEQLVDELFKEIDKYTATKKIEVDEAEQAEGAEWLQRIEEENAGELTPERLAKLEAEKQRADDDVMDEALLRARRVGLADGRAAASPAPSGRARRRRRGGRRPRARLLRRSGPDLSRAAARGAAGAWAHCASTASREGIRADGRLVAASVWLAPGEHSSPLLRQLPAWARLAVRNPRAVPQLLRAGRTLDALHPEEPHWFLSLLGVLPERQGTGLGGALMAPGLARADGAPRPPRHGAARRTCRGTGASGFEVTDEVQRGAGRAAELGDAKPGASRT